MDKTEIKDSSHKLVRDVTAHLSARRNAIRELQNTEPTDRRVLTQNALLAAGRTLIANNGVAGASVGDIAKEAGFTRGAFYSNFTDMDHFVSAVARIEWQSMLGDVEDVLADWNYERDNPIDGAVEILLKVRPRDRERYLLWNEFSTYEIRFPQTSGDISEGSDNFYRALGEILSTILDAFGLEPVGTLEDLIELIVALSSRSTRNEIIDDSRSPQRGSSSSLIGRLLPDLIRAMTRPAGAQSS